MGGIPVGELNMLEREFLKMIDWRLTVRVPPLFFVPSGVRLTHSDPAIDIISQCTREVLQEYYASLVRTHSKGMYVLAGTESCSTVSSDSEMDYEDPPSRPATPPSPSPWPQASTILVDTANTNPEPPQPPTVEQNMAYQAFRRQSDASMGREGFG